MNGHMMTDDEIQDKVDWLERQLEKNFAFVNEGHSAGNRMVKELMNRLKEVVIEYKRLAADYIEFKSQARGKVDFLNKFLSEWSQEEVIRT